MGKVFLLQCLRARWLKTNVKGSSCVSSFQGCGVFFLFGGGVFVFGFFPRYSAVITLGGRSSITALTQLLKIQNCSISCLNHSITET